MRKSLYSGLLVLFSSLAIANGNYNLSQRCHNAYLKVSPLQDQQTKQICWNNLHGGGFEFASGYLLEGDVIHAKEALGYVIEDLRLAKISNCLGQEIIGWALDEAITIRAIIG